MAAGLELIPHSARIVQMADCQAVYNDILRNSEEECHIPAEFIVSNPYIDGDIPVLCCLTHLGVTIREKVTSKSNTESAFDAGRVMVTVLFIGLGAF